MPLDTKEADLAKRLQAAIDRLHEDVRRVEIWAGALCAFNQPVPTYRANEDFVLPAGPAKRPRRRRAGREGAGRA